jgi:hypothetical protein
MLWFKRNLTLAVSGLLAVGLLSGALFYVFKWVGKNKSVEEELEQKKFELDKLYSNDPFPSSVNITTARSEVEKLKAAVGRAKVHFQPISYQKVTGLQFKNLLVNTIYQLTEKAEKYSIGLPEKPYFFSFDAQKEQLNLSPASFPAINEQLAEVEAICNILFDSRIHSLTGLKRVPVTPDDRTQTGFNAYREDWKLETNQDTGAVISPYEVSFTGFSSDLANVMQGFVASPHGFIIRALAIVPAPEAPRPGVIPGPFPIGPAPGGPRVRGGQRGFPPPGVRVPPPPPPPHESQVILDEKRFEATLWVAVVKPTR